MAEDLRIEIGANTRQLGRDLNDATNKLRNFTTGAGGLMSGFQSKIAGAFSIAAVSAFTKEVFNATAEYQKFGAVLSNTLGSASLANIQLKQIADFAARTPYGVNELTSSFVKLANAGFKPTGDQMRQLGDLAASTGKSFDQLAEAILDAQSGEFERLKEFGVRAKDAGDSVIFTYKGVETQVEKTSGAIRGYITSLGDAEGVSGSMEVISKTLTGQISNLGDTWDQMLVSVGSNTEGVFSTTISILNDALGKITQINKELNVASKYNIQGDRGFSSKINRALNPFASKGATRTELEVAGIQIAEEKVNTFVTKVISGAKSSKEFADAISQLAKESKALGGFLSLQEKQGVLDQYLTGINALRDAQINFGNQRKGPEANFGKSGKEKKAQLTPEQKDELEQQKRFAQYKVEGKEFEGKLIIGQIERNAAAQVEATKKAQEELEITVTSNDPLQEFFAKRTEANTQALVTPFITLKNYVIDEVFPQMQVGFNNFFTDILEKGKFSFAALGEAIKKTFISVLASESTKGVLSLLSGKAGGEGGAGKAGGLLGAIGGLFKGGGGAGAAAGGVAKKGLGGLLGSVLPFAGVALGAVGILGGLFKKKPKAQPMPVASPVPTYPSIQTGGAVNVFDGGRVVFEIAGQKLIGVLQNTQAANLRLGP